MCVSGSGATHDPMVYGMYRYLFLLQQLRLLRDMISSFIAGERSLK